jgi:hypothetical protein
MLIGSLIFHFPLTLCVTKQTKLKTVRERHFFHELQKAVKTFIIKLLSSHIGSKQVAHFATLLKITVSGEYFKSMFIST